ncbi:SDR family oxidoreductase [Gordonia alkanivorans]|uniref:SDR family oxidoreductase n=1 Tax=Gordonia alkanivorans TaxID=84096 RepID=UPI003571173C
MGATIERDDAAVRHHVTTPDGVRIAVYEEGNPDGETVLLLHGWPDSHRLWDSVAPLLRDRYRLIRVDNRGHGRSSSPSGRQAISTRRIADDYAAVIAHVADKPVHIIAHDWGSVSTWELITRPPEQARVASFTSISGPSMGHFAAWARRRLLRPSPANVGHVVAALASFAYSIVLSVPVLSTLLLRYGVSAGRWRRQQAAAEGIAPERIHLGETFEHDVVDGARIYRSTLTSRHTNPLTARPLPTRVPVQVLIGKRDPAIRYRSYADVPRWTGDLWLRLVHGGHWLPFSHPELVAQAAEELIESVRTGTEPRSLRRWRVGTDRRPFADQLVVVTGAGSGIGRATAHAFAGAGAEVVVSDIDPAASAETAELIGRAGGVAYAYRLDVSDPASVDEHAREVIAEHGVPDVLVNNAGIGHAGAFLQTPAADFDRVLQVNLQGVIGMCRAFAGAMSERGLGGQIVNLASMAAYSPQREFSAYSTSKSAVFMFSDCLRAELARSGVGVTTVCPGVVHTNITATTRFSGVSDEEEHRLQQHFDALYRRRGYTPDKVAERILRAVLAGETIVPVTPEAVVQYHFSRFAPKLTRLAAARMSLLDR